MSKKQPMQPIELDADNVARFKSNAIVRWLFDAGPFRMSQIASLPGISIQDREQFFQLIGYNISGFGELSCVRDKIKAKADRRAECLLQKSKALQ